MRNANANLEVKKRAAKARKILIQYYDLNDLETSAMDLMADMLHLCERKDWNIHDLIDRALEHVQAERMGL